MKVILAETLSAKNISRYKLSQLTGVTEPNLKKLCENKTSSISFNTLDKICSALDCEITDILLVEKDDTIG